MVYWLLSVTTRAGQGLICSLLTAPEWHLVNGRINKWTNVPPVSEGFQVPSGPEGCFPKAPFRVVLLTAKDPKPSGASESPGTACGNAGSQAPWPEILKQEGWEAAF